MDDVVQPESQTEWDINAAQTSVAPTAYSAEDGSEPVTEYIESGPCWRLPLALAAVILMVGGGIVAAILLLGRPIPRDVLPPPAAAPTAMTTVQPTTTTITPTTTTPPEPTTVTETVTAPPPSTPASPLPAALETAGSSPAEVVAAYDRQFIATLKNEGWTVWDPGLMSHQAHQVCALFQQGATPEYVNHKLATETGMGMDAALMFTSAAMLTYPNCP